MRPHVVLLGLHPDGTLHDAALHGLEVDQNLPSIRLDERLIFANTSYFEEMIHRTNEQFPEASYLAIVCNGINAIDVSGTEMLKDVAGHLEHHDVQLLLIGVKSQVMEVMKVSGLNQLVGNENIFSNYEQARKEVYARLPSDMTYAI
jgi:SulP family sulfate permease